jgi:glutathione S-transferase
MALELHMHPLSSYCWKVLIALYEAGTPFQPVMVDLGDPAVRTAYLQLSPFGKIPALRDPERGVELFETSIMIDYLDQYHPARVPLIPTDRDLAREVRLMDRIFDLHVHAAFQGLVDYRLRPEDSRDPLAPTIASARLNQAYDVLERRLAGRVWAAGDAFSLADCAAAPALFYADVLEPMGPERPGVAAYRARLLARPSVARAVEEAKPYFGNFPGTDAERARLPA